MHFSNSLIIHKENTKKINVSVWKSDEKLLSICILDFSFKNDFV